ncbi:histidine--tRNA ligase [Algoriphagus boritolerans]|uniref:Histidine--tRNA ligase n=1 Tax=Algoriphagus boritolerans DSM 17298 = JCM 18970 TaxID=1120964 RepID=A0A1H5WGB4_9BACT|nr:histidine--tRNA ligase [Algoriphagus boritolerans]SEF98388.1 histidyl-tRNA synthetase [Algoriphagus boritolerans DSM 17298 = JCM 18970]
MQKPSLPKGTRDFGPLQMARRTYILDTIKDTFQLFGYQQIETPAMENLSTLTGKYGDEGDQLLFKILNSGDFIKDVSTLDLEKGSASVLNKVSEKGLRYDLTVPFARYVVMNRNELTFPFKRFQIQPVWRADRPQKGRYREFYQCDADVVGTDGLVCEAEIILMIRRVFEKLSLDDYSIKINNRKILTGISEAIGEEGKEGPLCVAIDKLDKIGWEKVKEELTLRGFGEESLDKLAPLVALESDLTGKIGFLRQFLKTSETGLKGVEELEQTFEILSQMGENLDHIDFDIMLARGLSYYTGAIFEVKVHHVAIGSVSGGGRYDNLTGVFGLSGVSGVGFSFGVDRLYDVMEELDLFPAESHTSTRLLLTYFDQSGFQYALGLLNQFRKAGIKTEIYPNQAKIQKQFDFANKKGIPFVGVCGGDEILSGGVSVKNMGSGEQQKLSVNEAIKLVC